jgi:Icc-related predicted phosphoesterase
LYVFGPAIRACENEQTDASVFQQALNKAARDISMKLLLTSDLHQWIPKWDGLVAAVEVARPRFVLIAGDLLPKEGGVRAQAAFFANMRRHLGAMARGGPITVLTYLGNDDAHILESQLDRLEVEGLCINLNGRIHREAGLVFCGMNRVRDYPFGYKHWCASDGEYVACPEQYCGQGMTLDQDGNWVHLDDLVAYLTAKPSIGSELQRLASQLGADEMANSVWMVHQPPADLGMDICAHGERVGSPTLTTFIRQHRPLLGCSGHIHESPYQPGGRWHARAGNTVWVQPGQIDRTLHVVTLEISDDLRISGVHHSVLGDADE